jgi:hypothetical protein
LHLNLFIHPKGGAVRMPPPSAEPDQGGVREGYRETASQFYIAGRAAALGAAVAALDHLGTIHGHNKKMFLPK